MNILMLTPRFPYPPNRGDAVRSWAELEYLAGRHDVWLACPNEREPYPAQLAKVRSICRDVAVVPRRKFIALVHGGISLLRGRSLTEGFFADDTLKRAVGNWAKIIRFDAVLAFSSAMAPMAEVVDARRVLDMCDVDSHKWRVYADRSRPPLRWLYALEARRLGKAERRWVRSHDVTVVVNQRERRKLLARTNPRHAVVVRTPTEVANTTQAGSPGELPPPPTELIVGSLGSMFYPPNVRAVEWFGRHVWPQVKARMPAARWWIVGNRPTRRVRRWGRRQDVRVTGFVPDTARYLNAFRVFINPVDGDIGVQTKLLCAMAIGKPAVVTPDTAAGIDYDGEPPFLIARGLNEFADAVVRLLTDDALARQLGMRAVRAIQSYYLPHVQLGLIEQALSGQSGSETTNVRSWEAAGQAERGTAAAPVGGPTEVAT
jgi:sugar transferase (PEP-CTERM/EpsH1 system associated)